MSADTPTAPTRLRRWAVASVVANIGIVLTGGTVRLTGSGLGCPDWPTCDGLSVIPSGETSGLHTFIEFGNRTLTGVLLVVAVGVFLAAWRQVPRQRRLIRLAAIQPVGVLTQAVLGGITVLTGLHPLWVAAHFLVSAGLIAAAVALLVLIGGAAEHRPSRSLLWLVGLVTVSAAAVLVLGTLVTAAGPHAGDPDTPRLALDIRGVARLHAGAVWLLVGVTIASLVASHVSGAWVVRRSLAWLLGLEVAQGAVGYTQYALGIPEVLVAIHLLGATLVWAMAVRTCVLALARAPAGEPSRPRTVQPAAVNP